MKGLMETRATLRIERLSSMSKERRESVLHDLEALAEDAKIEPPAGSWVGPQKETLVAIDDGKVVGAVTVQSLPMIEPLILGGLPNTRAAVLEPLVRRAEGFMQGMGYDECFIMIDEEADPGWRDYVTRGRAEDQREGLIVFRDL